MNRLSRTGAGQVRASIWSGYGMKLVVTGRVLGHLQSSIWSRVGWRVLIRAQPQFRDRLWHREIGASWVREFGR